MRLATTEEEQAEAPAPPPLQPLDTNSPAKRRSSKRQQEASTSRAACTGTDDRAASPPAKKTKQEGQEPEEQEVDAVNTSSSASSSPATDTAAAIDAAVALAAEPSSLVVPPSAVQGDEEEAAAARAAEAEAQIQSLFDGDDDADDDDAMQEDGSGGYRYQPSARRVAEDKGEWRLVCSEDEGGQSEYETDSDLSSDDDDDDDDDSQGPKRAKKGKKRRPLRLGPKTIGQLQAALDADPEWRGLAVLARFLRDGLSSEDDVEAQRVEEDKEAVVPVAAAAMDVVAPVAAEGAEEQPPAMAAAPTPSPTTAAGGEEEKALVVVAAVEKEEEEEEEEEGTDPEAAAEARAAMAWHLRPRPMCPPFKEEEMAAIQEKARQLDANKKPPLEERRPPPYKKIRRLVFHESMKDRTHIFREDGQDAQCECVECAGAAPAQQEEQAGKKEKKGRGRSCAPQPPEGEEKKKITDAGAQQQHQEEEENDESEAGVLCGPGCINRSLHVECTPVTCRFAMEGRCRNQRITKREGKAFAVFKTEGRGWGVKASEDIRPGEFVMEYVGEVIDDEEVARRMWASKQAGAENYYMVEMNGATVDARDYGNEARFVNHACEPNCSLQKWLVDGSYRLALFSIKPIASMEELTWDYNFASFGEPKPCLCGAPNCRKVLAGKPQKEETPAAPLTAKGQQTQREAAAAEAFRRRVVLGKPLADVSDVVLFFNGRTARGEMARARRCRLWLTADGPVAASGATTKRRVLEQAVEAARDRVGRAAAAAASAAEGQAQEQQQQGGEAMAKIVAELEEMATARRSAAAAMPAHRALSRPCRRLGLLSLREKRLAEAATMGFAKSLLGEARVAAWPDERRAVVEDMVVFIRTSETAGLLTDLNEDACYSCNCSGDLLCCDSCTAAYHLSCAGLWQLPEEAEWLCNRCKKGAARSKRDAKQRERATGGTRA